MAASAPLLSPTADETGHQATPYGVTGPPLSPSDTDGVNHSDATGLRARLQIPLLLYARTMEPITFYVIFPYIAQMTKFNGDISDAEIGFYSGMFESLFSAVQSLVLISWGSMADRVGYRTMLMYSLSGMAIVPVMFGFSTTLWQMALFRALAGLFSGSNIIIRTMLVQRCTPENEARIFSWYIFADNIALFAGPLLGGVLAEPASQYPAIFGGISLFEHFPYALPGLVTGIACGSAAAVTILFMDDITTTKQWAASTSEREDGPDRKPSLRSLFRVRGMIGALCTLLHVNFIGSSMFAISATALYTPVSLGGMGYSAEKIAAVFTAQGICEAVWLLLAFPVLYRSVGPKGIVYLCATMFALVFADYTALNELLRNGSPAAQVLMLVGLGALVVLASGVLMAATSCQLALQNLSPDPRMLGTLNGVIETGTSIIKTVTPVASTTVFAVGVRDQILRGHLAWVLLMGISPALFVTIQWLPSQIPARGTKNGTRV